MNLPLIFGSYLLLSNGQPVDTAFFENRVRPVLVEHCGKCHGIGEGAKVKGGLRLDSRQALLTGGDNGPAIVLGKPETSRLVTALEYLDSDLQMPPRGKLPANVIADMRAWISAGAPWPASDKTAPAHGGLAAFDLAERKARHWAWKPLKQPDLASATGDPIDQLLGRARKEAGVSAAPSADRRTLLRRLSFDLTGLPPTPAETEAFVADSSPDALAKQVDRLLASPRFAEHWARHWLDLVRYAETRGHEFDFPIPNAWQYRDYVIRALDADVPYNQYLIEHLAGDLLSKPRLNPKDGFNESILGTGFFFLGEEVHSPVDVRQDEADRIDNRIDVLGKTFLGLTIACARCHDHKFDAISTKDYYALYAILESASYRQARFDTIEREKALAKRLATLRHEHAAIASKALAPVLERLAADWPNISTEARAKPSHPLHTIVNAPAKAGKAINPKTKVLVDYAKLPSGGWLPDGGAFGKGPLRVGEIQFAPSGMPVLPTRAAAQRDAFWPGLPDAPGNQGEPGSLSYPRAGRTLATPTFQLDSGKLHILASGKGTIRACVGSHVLVLGPLHGEMVRGYDHGTNLRWHRMGLERYAGLPCHIEISSDDPACSLVMIVEGDDPGPVPEAPNSSANPQVLLREAARLAKAGQPLTASPEDAIFLNAILASPVAHDAAVAKAISAWKDVEQTLKAELPGPSRLAPACIDGTGMTEKVFVRGSPRALGDTVPRRFIEALDPAPLPGTGSGRLDLANKIVDPAITPLLPRVLVNRLWHHLTGRGLMPSVDNFGELGDRFAHPAHGELLDHLALSFVSDGWSVKKMIRRIALSQAYAMSSRVDPASASKDPGNHFYHAARIRRLSGESLRDSLLALSGRLDERRFGPPIPPYMTAFQDGRGKPASGPLDGDGRRSVYLGVRRNFLSTWMLAFDTPNPFSTVGRRTISNVPAQALVLLNDPLVHQQAQYWAKQLAGKEPDDARVARALLESGFCRPPTTEEVADALAFLEARRVESGTTREDALALLAHAVINTKEFAHVR
ncbi:MAG: PSD1 and planctomycete cytochrome C domain-containing protein [Planctomycetota bacterium]